MLNMVLSRQVLYKVGEGGIKGRSRGFSCYQQVPPSPKVKGDKNDNGCEKRIKTQHIQELCNLSLGMEKSVFDSSLLSIEESDL